MLNQNFKEITVGGELYYLKKFKALKGLAIQKKIYDSGLIGEEGINVMALETDAIADIIINGCNKGSVQLDMKKFDEVFAGKYMEIYQLVAEILMFNFFNDPNDSADLDEA